METPALTCGPDVPEVPNIQCAGGPRLSPGGAAANVTALAAVPWPAPCCWGQPAPTGRGPHVPLAPGGMQAAAEEQQAVPPAGCSGAWKGREGQPQSLPPHIYLLHVAVRGCT